jgi:hypothetical protein
LENDMTQAPDCIDLLSGETVPGDEISRLARLRLPSDNWYRDSDICDEDIAPLLAISAGDLFARHDDGAGPRWFPVEVAE